VAGASELKNYETQKQHMPAAHIAWVQGGIGMAPGYLLGYPFLMFMLDPVREGRSGLSLGRDNAKKAAQKGTAFGGYGYAVN